MAHSSSVTIDKMRGKLITLNAARERLAATEPLEPHAFPVGSNVHIRIPQDWHKRSEEQLVPEAGIRTADALAGGTEYALTKKAILELGALGGIPREHQQQIPARLLEAEVNWWFTEGLGDKTFKLLKSEGKVIGLCRATINPFSNLRLLDTVLGGVTKQYGAGEVLVDYKFHHDPELTQMRLIVPGAHRTITGTREADDTWSAGLYVRNSLVGLKPPELSGYLFRWWCTNGCYDTLSTRTAPRRSIKDEDEAMEWAADAVDQVLGGLEGALDDVQALTQVPVEAEAAVVLRDLFAQHHIPGRERDRVLDNVVNTVGDMTMYDLQAAVTAAANMEGLSPRSVDLLLSAGGHVSHGASARCDGSLVGGCKRILPDNYSVPGAPAPAAE